MVLDNQAIFSDAQVVNSAVKIPSTNVLDLGALGVTGYRQSQLKMNLSIGTIPLLIQCVEGFTGPVTNVKVSLEQSVDAAFTVAEEVIAFDVPVAKLVAGYISPLDKLPRGITKRYIRLAYTADAVPTAGKITSGIVAAVDGAYQG